MTTKQYVEDLMAELKTQMDDNLKDRKRTKLLYNIGTAVLAVGGVSYLASNPWFALPVLGFAYSLQVTKNMKVNTSEDTYKSLIGQSEHLSNVLKDGIDIKKETMDYRKKLISQKEETRKTQESKFLSALSSHRFANALVAGMAVLGGFVTSPLVSIGSLILIYRQEKKDKAVVTAHRELEDNVMTMNNVINDYNTAAKAINNLNKKAVVNSTNNTTEATTAKSYSRADEEAVDKYINGLERQEEYRYAEQKRRI